MDRYRKALVAVAGLAGQALVLGLIPAPYDKYVSVILAALTALGVYAAPNAPMAR